MSNSGYAYYSQANASYSNTHLHDATPVPTPYGSGDPYYNESSGFINPHHLASTKATPMRGPYPSKARSGRSRWLTVGVPLLVVVVVAAVLGGVLGSRHHSDTSAASAAGGGSGAGSSASASAAASAQAAFGVFATATDSMYMLPLYPSTTNAAVFTTPTALGPGAPNGYPADPFQPSNPAPTSLRPDRPRLIAPQYKWAALPSLIPNNPYLKAWNASVFSNATQYYAQPVVPYYLDSGNGILDVARRIKQRIKAFAYCYRMSNNTQWVDRAWLELQNAAGNGTASFGPSDDTKWNPIHFLDTAELTNAFAIAYDWMYDAWTPAQQQDILWSMLTYGLQPGLVGWNNSNGLYWDWWNSDTQGNWNCVCNGGLTLGSLAILGDDPTGTAAQLLALTIPNAQQNCMQAVSSDGTWSETPNYWWFGVTGAAEMISALISAAGSDFGLLAANPAFALTGRFHMAAQGPGTTFNYGDNGVNKYSTTANALLLFAALFAHPEYALFQRDQYEAPGDPWALFWYDPSTTGAFWAGLPLDLFFTNSTDAWGAMRSSWTDERALYVAAKAGTLQGHQTHNDLDCGDFVLDALGTRWFGELGDDNYLADGYFSNDTQASERWLYYRKRTEGQNTVLVDGANQLVSAQPVVAAGSDGVLQSAGKTVYTPPSNSTAFWTADLTSAYSGVTSFQRGIRLINGRRQVLIQDDITATAPLMWRAHTNASVALPAASPLSAALTLLGEALALQIVNAPPSAAGVSVAAMAPTRLPGDPPLPAGADSQELPNAGVTVVVVALPAGTWSLQVLLSPQWGPGVALVDAVPNVPVSEWTLTSHDT